MDGNGRWAKKRLKHRIKGHEKGSDTVRMVVRTAREIGVRFLTLYAFSTENWQRPRAEVKALMELLKRFLKSETAEMMENSIRLSAIGQIDRLPQDVRSTLEETMTATQQNSGMTLTLALSYGGRAEIVRMARHIAEKASSGAVTPASLTADVIADHLYTGGMPDPDLLIRTGGEMRISNFLLWQIAYAEIVVTETLWPDFKKEEFIQSIFEYQSRERRFGRVSAD
jgi:undecaprenyl diphosphate synthase